MSNRATSSKVDRFSAADAVVAELADWSGRAGGPGGSGGSVSVYRQLARGIAHGIERGAFAPGSRLPSERTLAGALSVSRGTAVAAYDVLVADGLVERRPGSGSFVAAAFGPSLPADREGSPLVHRLVDQSAAAVDDIDLSLSVLHDVSGLRGLALRPRDLATVVPDTGYSPWGLPELRTMLAAHVAAWGLQVTADQIVVTTGAQQAISVAAACWVRPGDTVVVDDPTYPGAIAAFRQAGATLVGVPVDRHGVDTAALAAALRSHPALVYVQSGAHSPTGTVLAERRRAEIARLVTAARVPLVEDLALADLTWDHLPPAISSLPGPSGAVVGSLSKVFWGGLRVGFLVAPAAVALRLARVKATQDLGSSVVSQLLARRLLESAGDGFVDRRRAELRARHDVLADALRRSLPTWQWAEPRGGLSLWVRLPRGDGESFARVATRHGVGVAGPAALSIGDAHADRIRLSFSAHPDALIEGVRRLTAAWQGSF